MKTIFKLLIVLAICNALFRGAFAFFSYYEFRDSAEQAILFAGSASSRQVHSEILELAARQEIPLLSQNLTVRRSGSRRTATATYTQPIELFPRYTYVATFSFLVSSYSPGALAAEEDR